MSGASFVTVMAASPILSATEAKAKPSYPNHMKIPGAPSSNYGLPSQYETAVKRTNESFYKSGIFTGAHTPLDRLNGTITPSGLHFSIHHNGIPDINPAAHEFLIHGFVNKPMKWSIETLLNYPIVSRIQFLECSGNSAANAVSSDPVDASCTSIHGQVSCSEWAGIPLKYLLDEVGVNPKGKWAMCEGADAGNHVRNVPLEKLYDDAIIALYQNGERIRPDQGYPMRLFVPGYEGNMNVKWLHRMEITDQPSQSKDEQSLYAEFTSDKKLNQFTFFMEVKSIITKPSGTQQLPDKGLYEIAGLAWSGRGRIEKVEVSADSGKTWVAAHLEGPVMSKSFTRFTIPWRWNGQGTILMSRATDEFGNVQPSRDEWKSRYEDFTFNHYNAINAWLVNPDGGVKNVYV
ncbi:sulfite dehydrogenase [Colwellia psychrerythraea]|uniref:sulfite dehydrogenase n=1 Tax=Colwellia psychrerythraea TaxID=28229 RepID=UPI0021DB7557|nr:sulfite dehydrogenase [Colwellia psychrerythraea]